ncbi:MAG: hypothetical protein QOH39_1214 [Verrucomicrobiota bacterium]|jgi:hypothetical protein
MKTPPNIHERGSTLMVTIAVVATLLVLLGAAVEYTQNISRLSQRSRKTALAMEIADGHLEYLFTNWRNIYRKTWSTTSNSSGGTDYSVLGTNYFFTDMYNPGPVPTPIPYMTPSATPLPISLPAKSNFPTEPNYSVTQYRIQAVDPQIQLDANENAQKETSYGSESYTALSPSATPPAGYGPNTWQYSFYYLAAVDVTVPAMTGNVTAKVRRVFEKKFDNPWTYAMFYADDLEFQPTAALTINGPIQTNGSLYIGTSNFTAQSKVGYSADYVNGYSPNDTSHSGGGVTAPNFPSNMPPSQGSPYLPFGWNLNLNNTDGSTNNDSYHELIERPGIGTDDLANVRYYNQAGYRVLIDASNNVTITDSTGASITSGNTYNQITGAITTNQVIYDVREGAFVRLTTIDIAALTSNMNKLGGNGIMYFSDTSAGTSVSTTFNGTSVTTAKRGIRLKNGATLPSGGMTFVAENPVYIQGNYNTGGNPPSNTGTYTSPTVSGYTRQPSAVVGDAINVLSGAWSDANSNQTPITQYKAATSTTVNAALVGGIVPSTGGNYGGGGENFVRFLEDWTKNSAAFTYYGSMVELFPSQQANGVWSGSGNIYKAPGLHWFYDTTFGAVAPPGKLQIAAYLQQQRWFQVY